MDSGEFEVCRRVLRFTWEAQGLKPRTIQNRLRAFEACGGPQATHASIMDYLATLTANSTRRARRSDIQVTFKTLLLAGVIGTDPSVALPKIRATRWTPRPLTDDEVQLLFDAADEEMRDMLTVALYAGLRASEIANLRAEQMERWNGRWALRIQGKGDVVGTIPAHPRVVQVLLGKRGPLWPGATANSVSHKANRLFRSVGLTGGIHRCRHTFATRALEASGQSLLVVRDLLRHASVSTTQVYTYLPDSKMFEAMAKIA